MTWMEWYDSLWKPSWTPVPATIAKKVPWKVTLPFAVNLVANLIFMPILAGLHNLPLALLDILIVWATIIGTMIIVWKHYKWVAVVQVSYSSQSNPAGAGSVGSWKLEYGWEPGQF